MHRFNRPAALASLGAALVLVFTTGAVAAHRSSDVAGHVYVNNNAAGHNSISGFDRHADGSLTRIPGSPFMTGGAGTGSPVATQGAIQFSADRRFVLAVDAGSDEVSVLRIASSGRLKRVDTVPSHGNVPGSISVSGNLVYVANTGAGGMNYTGFRLDRDGELNHVGGSTFALPDDAFPGLITFSADGRHAVGIRTGGTPTAPTIGPSLIDSFVVDSNGRLDAAAGSPFPSQKIGPIGAEFKPTNSGQLFVTNAHEGPGLGSVSSYDVAADGGISAGDGSPYPNGQTATCWVDISSDGETMFVVNTATPSVSSYTVANDGSLTVIGSSPFKTAVAPFDLRLDPTGSYLYVVDAGAARIHAFAVRSGRLAELAGSPFANPGAGAAFGVITN